MLCFIEERTRVVDTIAWGGCGHIQDPWMFPTPYEIGHNNLKDCNE